MVGMVATVTADVSTCQAKFRFVHTSAQCDSPVASAVGHVTIIGISIILTTAWVGMEVRS